MLALCGLARSSSCSSCTPEIVLAMPEPYTLLQFGTRLESYVLLTLVGAMIVALRSPPWHRRAVLDLVGVADPRRGVVDARRCAADPGSPSGPALAARSHRSRLLRVFDYKTSRLPVVHDASVLAATKSLLDGRRIGGPGVDLRRWSRPTLHPDQPRTIPELVHVEGAQIAAVATDVQDPQIAALFGDGLKGYVLQVDRGSRQITVTEPTRSRSSSAGSCRSSGLAAWRSCSGRSSSARDDGDGPAV